MRAVEIYFEESRSDVAKRPDLEPVLGLLADGEELIVHKLDRLTRSVVDVLRIIDRIGRVGAKVHSLTEPIETVTPAGRMIVQLLAVLAEFERAAILER